jgi:hypothetical protein
MRKWDDVEQDVYQAMDGFRDRRLDRLSALCEAVCHIRGGEFRDRDERLPASQEEICLMEASGYLRRVFLCLL